LNAALEGLRDRQHLSTVRPRKVRSKRSRSDRT
jgi:hypothetical protein